MKHRLSISLAGLLVVAGCGRDGTDPISTPDARSSTIQVTIASVEAVGADLRIQWRSSKPIQNIWYPACGTAPHLLKSASGGWAQLQDDRPWEGTMQPYYLDGVYIENRSMGCDGGNSCFESTGVTLSTLEYIQVGTRPPREPYIANNTNGPSEAPVPDLVSRATTAPYQLELKYMVDTCPSAVIGVARLDLP